jgi:hypothetical protein
MTAKNPDLAYEHLIGDFHEEVPPLSAVDNSRMPFGRSKRG